jgi:bifunctional non-homologous end joining protein LigD
MRPAARLADPHPPRLDAGMLPLKPCLPTRAPSPPAGPDWLHEIKHDGFRMIAHRNGRARLLSRHGRDWGDRFPAIVAAVEALAVTTCTIDGEVIACRNDGLADFELLRYSRRDADVTLVAFDLIELDGRDLRREPIETRKAELTRLLDGCRLGLVPNAVFHEPGPIVFQYACALGCEGIVSKRRGSRYIAGRTHHWLKVKNPDAPAVRREREEDWPR